MRELNVHEINNVNGGSVAIGVFATGAGAAALAGAALGPVGVAVGVAVYAASFGITSWMMR